jgi:hypothetical protein
MPIALEHDLERQASRLASSGKLKKKKKMGLKDAEQAYVWGTMRKIELQHRAKGGAPGKYMKHV